LGDFLSYSWQDSSPKPKKKFDPKAKVKKYRHCRDCGTSIFGSDGKQFNGAWYCIHCDRKNQRMGYIMTGMPVPEHLKRRDDDEDHE